MMNEETEIFLIHHGVKGQKWGIRKLKFLVGRQHPLSLYKENQKVKFGPGSLSGGNKKAISEHTKHVLEVGGGIAAAGLIGAVLFKYGKITPNKLTNNVALATLDGGKTLKIDSNFISVGKELTLPKGTMFRRVSTVAETEIRSDGFYATYKPKDVSNYMGWGSYITHLKAETPIHIPSSEKVAAMRQTTLSQTVMDRKTGKPMLVRDILTRDFGEYSKPTLGTTDKGILSRPDAFLWTDSTYGPTKAFFDEAKKNGYNALWDYNNMGEVSENPVRVIDGSVFSISKNEHISPERAAKIMRDGYS